MGSFGGSNGVKERWRTRETKYWASNGTKDLDGTCGGTGAESGVEDRVLVQGTGGTTWKCWASDGDGVTKKPKILVILVAALGQN